MLLGGTREIQGWLVGCLFHSMTTRFLPVQQQDSEMQPNGADAAEVGVLCSQATKWNNLNTLLENVLHRNTCCSNKKLRNSVNE